jgi:carboxymethylenebutenolidase
LSFHGTKVEDYLELLDKVKVPLSLHWGDRDHTGPPEVLEAVRLAISGRDTMEMHVYPGVGHGYTAPSSDAWNKEIAARSWQRAVEILNGLRTQPAAMNA